VKIFVYGQVFTNKGPRLKIEHNHNHNDKDLCNFETMAILEKDKTYFGLIPIRI